MVRKKGLSCLRIHWKKVDFFGFFILLMTIQFFCLLNFSAFPQQGWKNNRSATNQYQRYNINRFRAKGSRENLSFFLVPIEGINIEGLREYQLCIPGACLTTGEIEYGRILNSKCFFLSIHICFTCCWPLECFSSLRVGRDNFLVSFEFNYLGGSVMIL